MKECNYQSGRDQLVVIVQKRPWPVVSQIYNLIHFPSISKVLILICIAINILCLKVWIVMSFQFCEVTFHGVKWLCVIWSIMKWCKWTYISMCLCYWKGCMIDCTRHPIKCFWFVHVVKLNHRKVVFSHVFCKPCCVRPTCNHVACILYV